MPTGRAAASGGVGTRGKKRQEEARRRLTGGGASARIGTGLRKAGLLLAEGVASAKMGRAWMELPPGDGAYDEKGHFSPSRGVSGKAERSEGEATLREGGAAFWIDLSED